MKWADFLPIIARYGLPLAMKLWQKITSGAVPTQADWDELITMGQQTPEQLATQAAHMRGMAPDDPKLLQILALLASPVPAVPPPGP